MNNDTIYYTVLIEAAWDRLSIIVQQGGVHVDAQMKKGLLDVCVLFILKDEDTYGYKLTQQITELFETSESALYPVLRRLESQDLLETYSAEYSGRLRKYYRITAAGITRLNEYVNELGDLKRVIDYIIGGGKNG